MLKVAGLVALLSGCSLYFDEPHESEKAVPHVFDAGAPPGPDAQTCPATGTHAEITYPLDGATNVANPVPIAIHKYIPNTLDGIGVYITDADGNPPDTSLFQYQASCSIPVPQIQSGPVQDFGWTDCYDLPPGSTYTWHVWITCYDPSGPHELAKSTFTTAP